ncbi:cupin domain-containing protein [Sediminibacillus dalangtanensis]|uniref:Cupin domain-containing protein n=1 Tax=Sediminibacillus dalangtanensis TaxID=2729421 RepID=A0ABX7VRL9_9BACI|nr:cupin domain-containing protein [Sediminibacillus dalangtanensis]QTM98098.1 cupin domain-containing protein [Sediminibacillus dalangtanensis]
MTRDRISTFLFSDDGKIPNNSTLPLVVYPEVLLDRVVDCEMIFNGNNWLNSWTGGVFDYHHFHSNTHEVLGIISGKALIAFGGEQGREIPVAAGDVVVIPAGVGHKKVEASSDFSVVGAYPDGATHDLLTGKPEEREQALENIAEVPVPDLDPVFAEDGPLLALWTKG